MTDTKCGAAKRWVQAVNADGNYGRWQYSVAQGTYEVRTGIGEGAASH